MAELKLKTIGKYQLLDQIGSSAAGTTYRARDPFRPRELAIKVISDIQPLGEEAKGQLYTALAACSELTHRHIRKPHDLGEVDGQVYLASDLLTGADLAAFLGSQNPSVAQKLSLVAQVCEALAFAHGKGVIHGNLKPANIFVADGSYATVLDFGIGAWQSSMLAAGARLEGLLPNYFAPERVLGEPFDERSDVFSIALILYEALTGKYPFEVPAGLIPRELVHADPAPLRKADPQMPEELEQLLIHALYKNREQRLQTADEFAASLYTIARKFRRDQPAASPIQNVVPEPLVAPDRGRASSSDKKADSRVAPATDETALQPWSARSFTAQAPAREEPARPQPAPAATRPTAGPAVPPAQTQPAQAPPGQNQSGPVPPNQGGQPAPASPAQSPVGRATPPAAPAGPPGPMPQRFQRTAPPRTSHKLRNRILTAAAGAVIAVWLVGSFVSRQSLHATQSKGPVETAAPKNSVRDLEPQPPDEPKAAADQRVQKAAEPSTKDPSGSQVLRLRVKPLWEAGKYSEAMEQVNEVLADEPSSAEARAWKKKIRAAQDAEAAVK